MNGSGIFSLVIIVANIIVSYRGFKNEVFFDRYKFQVDKITINRQYERLVTSGFLHVNWVHLIFNMFSLYFFGPAVAGYLGDLGFLVIYFGSMLAGSLFSLFVHRRDGSYSAVGASGAVCGLIFVSIAIAPQSSVASFFMPIPIRVWLYGLIFVAVSIYGIRSRRDNVGHECHLAGALTGMLITLAFVPSAFLNNWPYILLVAMPSIVFIYIIITRPHLLLVDNLFFKNTDYNYTIDHRYNIEKADKQKEVDRILDKISRHGMKSLSQKEKEMLKEYSKVIQ